MTPKLKITPPLETPEDANYRNESEIVHDGLDDPKKMEWLLRQARTLVTDI